MRHAKCRVAIGSDLNARIAPLEELRSMEYTARIANQQRGVWVDGTGSTATALLQAGTSGGAASLGLNAGEIAPGRLADFVAFDLNHPSLAFIEQGDLDAAILFGAGQEAIAGVMVGGTWVRGGVS
jgi:cytosine/adenosine deaminase-related metal-dependent hydrolase